ncbi:hypothetical protein F2P81_005401 [Scophthalmus maximus]|uniref:Uncharacterized protein n=1 Tax=Scophthalmus maximus TaxID=52904 RepID=A0A6A4TAG3_SCOMX|nr:hypothetical protein F2P81_005401 [Scophthalmus maximus]
MDVNRNNNGTRGLPSADRTEADFAAYSEMPELLSCSNVSGITPSVVRRTAKGTEKETKTDVVFKLQCKQRMKTLGCRTIHYSCVDSSHFMHMSRAELRRVKAELCTVQQNRPVCSLVIAHTLPSIQILVFIL